MNEEIKKIIIVGLLTGTIIAMNLHIAIIENKFDNFDEKLDTIASQTDATADKVDSLESDFTKYQQNNKDVIDSLNKQLNDFIEHMNDEIERLDEDIEAVEIAKAEARKRQTYTASKTTYTQNTDGLTANAGVNYYGEQKETYYNLNMNGVVNNAQSSGIEGDYWVREDGVKMYGEYVIVAANQDVHPYGTTVETSLGEGIVLDTGSFANENPTQVDIATDW